MSSEHVDVPIGYRVADGIATVILNRPKQLNALTLPMMRRLTEVLGSADADPEIRVIIVTGAGSAFCAGGDFSMLAEFGTTSTERENALRALQNATIADYLRHSSAVTIAAINGPCMGAGLAIACAADLRYCTKSAIFGAAYLQAGRSGDLGVTWTLPQVVGPAIAREMLLTSRRIDAERARKIHLVHDVFPDDQLSVGVQEIAQNLLRLPPMSVAAMKRNLNDADAVAFRAHLAAEADRLAQVSRTEDAAAAVRALIQKSTPNSPSR